MYRCRVLEKIQLNVLYCRVLFIDTGVQETILSCDLIETDRTNGSPLKRSNGCSKCFVLHDLASNNKTELWTNEVDRVMKDVLGQKCEIINIQFYEGEGPNNTDLYTCSSPSISAMLVSQGVGKGNE